MSGVTYKKAGVDIDKADNFIKKIIPLIEKTSRPEVLGKIGGFSGLFQPDLKKIKDPVLVSSTDGVGTKLLLAEIQNKYDTVGIDLVAMCVNDIVVTGAEPLFFLDYIAVGKIDENKLFEIMKGITSGCQEAGCALVGGETAELPGMYDKGKWDLAGFCVGIAGRKDLIDGSRCSPGDKLIGLASRGIHSNGFSLVRKVFSLAELKGKLGRELLQPTRIYVRPVLAALKKFRIKTIAHITGGGFLDNIPRILPNGLDAVIKINSWPVPSVFKTIQKMGTISDKEMYRTFNMGVGMVLAVEPQDQRETLNHFQKKNVTAWEIGELTAGSKQVKFEQ